MKNILNVKKVSLKPILMSLAILFNVFAINGTVAFASLNNDNKKGDELNNSQPNLGQPIGNSNGAKNLDNSRIPDRVFFENDYDKIPEEFFFVKNFLKSLNNDPNNDNNCNNNFKDNGQQGD